MAQKRRFLTWCCLQDSAEALHAEASHREAGRSLSSMIDVALIHHIMHAAQIRISEVKCRVLLIYTLLRFISEAKSWVLD
jgi:hypothetical protein